MNILSLPSWEQMSIYKEETGETAIEMFAFNEWLMFKMLDEI